jgi:hypothetical protein
MHTHTHKNQQKQQQKKKTNKRHGAMLGEHSQQTPFHGLPVKTFSSLSPSSRAGT